MEDIDKDTSIDTEKKSSSTKKSTAKKSSSTKKSTAKKSSTRTKIEKSSLAKEEDDQVNPIDQLESKTTRPIDEVVVYDESDFELREIVAEDKQIMIGPKRLTRFERARITGARALQLSLGAPSLVIVTDEIRNSISIAIEELEMKVLPLSIRRILPNGLYQDIPIDWLIA